MLLWVEMSDQQQKHVYAEGHECTIFSKSEFACLDTTKVCPICPVIQEPAFLFALWLNSADLTCQNRKQTPWMNGDNSSMYIFCFIMWHCLSSLFARFRALVHSIRCVIFLIHLKVIAADRWCSLAIVSLIMSWFLTFNPYFAFHFR